MVKTHMTEFNESMNSMRTSLKNISDLLVAGSLALQGEGLPVNPWVLKPVYEDENCSMGMVLIKSNDQKPCEAHIHDKSFEYLIVTKGKLLLHINDRAVRIVNEGECASIPPGTLHFSQPLTDDTQLAYICVPKDTKIPTLIKVKD